MKTESSDTNTRRCSTLLRAAQFILLAILSLLAPASASAVGNVVFSQVYGGGGGGTSYYKYDYVELYNRTDVAVSLTGWSIQYGSANGNVGSSSSLVYAIPAGTVIQPGGYLLIQMGSPGSVGLAYPLPPDLISSSSSLNLSASSGKVALANTTTPLNLPGPSGTGIMDFVGYGAANQGEGGTKVNNGAAFANASQGASRKMAGFRDTDDNNSDFDVVTPPVPRNSKVGMARFFASNLLPPTNGVYVSPPGGTWAYANGCIISNFVQRLFTGSVPPPPPGAPTTYTFNSTAEFEFSLNSGLTWQAVSVSNVGTTVQVGSNSTVGGYVVYTNVMTGLSLSGGSLPGGVLIRQNPGTNSPGQMRTQTIPGGYMISSFFDVFTQISTDGGLTWLSASNGPTHLEVKPDPALVTAAPAPRTVMPMPNGQFLCSPQFYQNACVIKDVKHRLFTAWMEPPVFGYTNTHTFNSQLDFQFSYDGGVIFMPVRAPTTVTMKISNVRGFQGQSTYETEVTQFDVSGGDLPTGVRLRVSPTRLNAGGICITAGGGGGGAGGGAAISSFFDIFTELSTDGGVSYYPAISGPSHQELQRIAPANLFPNNSFPPPSGEFISSQQWWAHYANGIIITNTLLHSFTAAITPPSPGGSLYHSFGAQLDFDLSQDGGLSFTPASAPGTVTVQITTRTGDDGTTVYYDTEMTQLSIGGGDLPTNILIRESPTKASLGRTTSSAVSGGNGGYQIDSFFDIYTEVSTDGGQTWQPTMVGPATDTLRPSGPTPAALDITCPTNMTVTTASPAGVVVNYAPLVSGTCPPFTTNCVPPSGSTFPIGNTLVNCVAKDSCGNSTNCSFNITVVPQALAITCPSNITVRATSPAGAVVNYVVTTTGGCPPVSVTAVPPSGSTFPIGVTMVNCVATDKCGQQVNCSFTVTVLRQLQKRFYARNLLPPTNGLYVPPAPGVVTFPGGIIVSNVAHRVFSAGAVPPPSVGGSLTHSFSAQVELAVSFDSGLTWQACVVSNASTQIYMINNGLDSGDTLYGAQMLQLDVSGGTLPAGVMIRESPTLASTGETRIQTTAGGYLIDSFFDIYLEISTDFGGTWMPAAAPLRLELKPDPALIPAVLAPRRVMPMPNGQDIPPSAWFQLYANGVVIKDARHKLFTGWMEPPIFGASQTHTFDSQLDFQLSTDGGMTFVAARAPATMTLSVQNMREFQGRSTYETQVTQFDIAGGDLPVGVMLRESPTKASSGGWSMLAGGGGGGAGGGAAISSFFDIFTELSTDGGASWGPATNGPAHMELRRIAPVNLFASNVFPPLTGEFITPQQWWAYYANGIVITNPSLRAFTAAITPPLPGFSTGHTFGAEWEFDISYDGGLTYSHTTAPTTVGVQLTGRLGDDGVTEYCDIEMTQNSIAGGGLPANIQIRESPTRASLGRTTTSTVPGGSYQIDSFFDIFTEVTTDGGMTWMPSVAGSATMTLRPRAPLTQLSVTCPSNLTVRATSPAGTVVTYPAPVVSGGCPPYTINCVPPSGSTFPIGATVVRCSVTDVCGGQASCSFTVTVLWQLQKRFYLQNLLPPTNGMYMPPAPGVITFPSGIILSNIAHRVFSAAAVPPPSVGGSLTHSFSAQVELAVSFDGGLTWQSCVASNAPTQIYLINNGLDSGDTLYGAQLLQLNASGGSLPAGVMIRESPTLASAGETRLQPTPGGYLIDSFFDVWLEISTDYGSTWVPASVPLRLELKPDPQLIAAAPAPRTVFPMPNGQYVGQRQAYANGIILRDIRHKLFTGWMEPPVFGASQTHTFDSQHDFMLSTDGGATWTAARAPSTVTVTINNVRGFQGRSTYETEMTQLDMAGGDLPVGVLIRESPTKASRGGNSSLAGGGGGGAGGGAAISSFFDIFTEVSTDGGGSWGPATNGPAHLELQRFSPAYAFTNNLIPVLTGQWYCPQAWSAYFANGIVITNLVHRQFTSAITPPLPGYSTSHTYGSTEDFYISYDGGLSYTHTTAPATIGWQMTGRLGDDGVTEYYDMEWTQLSVAGGGLPAGVMIRESPTRASLGRITSSAASGGNYQTDSFFDIYTEVSTDGGFSWYPTVAGPATMILRPQISLLPPTPAIITSIVPVSGGYTINYTNGGGSQFILLAYPKVTAPMSIWTPVATNTTGVGSFSVSPGSTTFYRVQSK